MECEVPVAGECVCAGNNEDASEAGAQLDRGRLAGYGTKEVGGGQIR